MASINIPEGYPDIYWLGLGSYEELSDSFEAEYGFRPTEGQTTEEVVQRLKNEGFDIPDKPPMDCSVCDLPVEERRNLLQELLGILKNNDCEPCVENARQQILELLKCNTGGSNG